MPAPAALAVIAAYRFVDLPDAAALRERLHASAGAAGLRGTLLIAPEGLNFTLAGPAEAMDAWFDALCADERLAPREWKRHTTATWPFQRLKVKLKREIIRMNEDGVRPQAGRAPAVDAPTLARWLAQGRCDAGRELVLLDTRNGWEVDRGSFEGALDWRLDRFSDFPRALQAHRADLEGRTVVSFCTGGIRCEKAAIWMQQQGLRDIWQLDGGILRYFEAVPGAPGWRGDCVVFDERAALAPEALAPADATAAA